MFLFSVSCVFFYFFKFPPCCFTTLLLQSANRGSYGGKLKPPATATAPATTSSPGSDPRLWLRAASGSHCTYSLSNLAPCLIYSLACRCHMFPLSLPNTHSHTHTHTCSDLYFCKLVLKHHVGFLIRSQRVSATSISGPGSFSERTGQSEVRTGSYPSSVFPSLFFFNARCNPGPHVRAALVAPYPRERRSQGQQTPIQGQLMWRRWELQMDCERPPLSTSTPRLYFSPRRPVKSSNPYPSAPAADLKSSNAAHLLRCF